jgi:hypothetical protein
MCQSYIAEAGHTEQRKINTVLEEDRLERLLADGAMRGTADIPWTMPSNHNPGYNPLMGQ